MKKRTRNLIVIVVIVIALVIAGGLYIAVGNSSNTKKGIKYIKQQEQLSTKSLQKTLTQIRNEEQRSLMEAGMITPFDLFHDYVIYGDSRVCGFVDNGFLPSSRVFARTGDGISSISKWNQQLDLLKPSHIYFLYGINELDEIILDKGKDYKEEYTKSIRKVMSSLPESHIYVCSIIQVSASKMESEEGSKYADVPSYNRIIRSMCEENGWTFVDLGDSPMDPNSYEADGIHFKSSFYTTWASVLTSVTED